MKGIEIVLVKQIVEEMRSANTEIDNRYMATATSGATILFPDEAFNPEATLRAVSLEISSHATFFYWK